MKNIKLYISTFQTADRATDDIFCPVSAGAALYAPQTPCAELCDNTGEQISVRNPQYCELTVQYWAWKNRTFDVGGLMHRRRWFDFSDPSPLACDQPKRRARPYRIYAVPDTATRRKIGADRQHIDGLTQRYRMLAPLRERLFESVTSFYNRNDRRTFDDLGLLQEVIREASPDYRDAARQYFSGSEAYFCNLFAADREIFCQYSEWLFGILAEYEQRKPAGQFYPREQGKLAERLFGVYMTHLRQETDVTWAELPRAHFAQLDGATPRNLSFDRRLYRLAPPGSRRRALLRKLKTS